MDAACTIQDSIHVFSLVRKYVSRILGTYQDMIPGISYFVIICVPNSTLHGLHHAYHTFRQIFPLRTLLLLQLLSQRLP